ncbi:hypothetical protein AXF41_12940 [Clostridium haemolyticum]|nr:hypothetical protein AXF41_12940 [Clostridium haemolyticum]
MELGVEFIVSDDTSKIILDNGVKYSVDEACLPIKIFHGHVSSLVGRCDLIIVPRIMSIRKKNLYVLNFVGFRK